MSIEQIIFLFVFVVLGLLQKLAAKKRNEAQPSEPEIAIFEDSSWQPDRAPEPPVLPRPAPPPPIAAKPEAAAGLARRAQQTARLARAKLPPPTVARSSRASSRTTGARHAQLKQAVPHDRVGLRRAMLLMEILGRPRSLDPLHRS